MWSSILTGELNKYLKLVFIRLTLSKDMTAVSKIEWDQNGIDLEISEKI